MQTGPLSLAMIPELFLQGCGYNTGPRGVIFKSLSIISSIALLTVGLLVLKTHIMPLPTACWVIVGVGGSKILFDILADDFKKGIGRPTTILVIVLTVAATSTIGTLGILGHLSQMQVGWAIVGITTGAVGLYVIGGLVFLATQDKLEEKGYSKDTF